MNSVPLVSVCVQTYQHVNYIKSCLDGILMQQTTFPFEVILGEDESSDGTRDICIEYTEKHSDRIRLFLRSRKDVIFINGNPTGRYNMVENLKASKGKYIALCEGDDYWTDPLKLQKQVDFLEANPYYAITFTNGEVNYENKLDNNHLIYCDSLDSDKPYSNFKTPNSITSITDLANGNYLHTAGVVFKNWIKEKGIPEYLYKVTIGDWPLHMRTSTFGLIKYLDINTFCYRVHENGIFSKKSILEKYKMTIGQFAPMLNSDFFNEDVRLIIENYCLRSCGFYLKICKKPEDVFYVNSFINSLDSKNTKLKNSIKTLVIEQKSISKKSFYLKFKKFTKRILNKL
ncbi:glycosyltransferase family 2 protein [Flavisericum labens]|uniref:glycosyltransferase family 2 protein n=1 Tax=Flavisericum labens TaxID=3377112 RepID=UPI00387AFCB7